MTKNQIDYWTLQENKRHNVSTEEETKRSNQAKEAENFRSNTARETETNRHNVATEQVDIGRLNETVRHNKISESQTDVSLAESARHNKALESLQGRDLNIRAQQVAETGRHNVVSEGFESTRVEYESKMAEVNSRFRNSELSWMQVLNDQKTDINQAEVDRINSLIEKYRAEISHMETQDDYTGINSILRGVEDLSNMIFKLKVGGR